MGSCGSKPFSTPWETPTATKLKTNGSLARNLYTLHRAKTPNHSQRHLGRKEIVMRYAPI